MGNNNHLVCAVKTLRSKFKSRDNSQSNQLPYLTEELNGTLEEEWIQTRQCIKINIKVMAGVNTRIRIIAHILHVATTLICNQVCYVSGIKHHHLTGTSLDGCIRAYLPATYN